MELFIIGLISGLCLGFSISTCKSKTNSDSKDNEWNPVKKGIPEPKIDPLTGDNVKYLCTFKRKFYDDFRRIGIFWVDECGRWISKDGYDYTNWVIAWRKMPPIYMGKNNK